MHKVSYRRIEMAIKMASKVGSFCIVVLLIVALAAARAIRIARWRGPVASGEALVMLNRLMRSVLLQCVRVAIEMACDRDTFVRSHRLF
jgi:hypothetical protein